VFVELACSVAAENEAAAASIHWGFDGTSFSDCAGSWRVEDGALSESQALACAMEGPELTQIDAPPAVADATGAVTGWLVPVRPQRSIEPALIAIWRDRRDAPFLGHRRALVRAADYVSLALSRASEQDRLLYLAGHDSLTGTANRAAFVESLDQMLGHGEVNIAVGYADLDGFKQVNDRFGHAAGDEILVAVAERIRSQLRSGDLRARIGGDEFTLLLRNVPETGVAEGVARRVVDALSTDFAVDANCVRLGVSVGIAMGRSGADATTLLREADAALYEAKRARSSISVAPLGAAPPSP
jgi:diguanylate cyclase (GGDEF)-like protein